MDLRKTTRGLRSLINNVHRPPSDIQPQRHQELFHLPREAQIQALVRTLKPKSAMFLASLAQEAQRPSFFEMVAQQYMLTTLKPALRYILAVLAQVRTLRCDNSGLMSIAKCLDSRVRVELFRSFTVRFPPFPFPLPSPHCRPAAQSSRRVVRAAQ